MSPEDDSTVDVVMSGTCSQESPGVPGVGLWVLGGLCPSRCLGPGWVGNGQGPLNVLPESHTCLHPATLLPQLSITWGLSHHT